MFFQIPLKFIITRERPIEWMLKVYEWSNCLRYTTFRRSACGAWCCCPTCTGFDNICGCARHSLAWFLWTHLGLPKLIGNHRQRFLTPPPLTHTRTQTHSYTHTFLNVAWRQRSCFRFQWMWKKEQRFLFGCTCFGHFISHVWGQNQTFY